MKNHVLIFFLVIITIPSCRGKEKEDPNQPKFISVASLIKEQVAHIDTSLYSIMKVVSTDSLHIDTSYVPREEFAIAAKDFMDIPDLSEKKIAKRFREEPVHYEKMLNRVIFTYVPVDPDKEPVKKIELLVTPVLGTESKVTNIIVNWGITTRDSSLQKKMLWLMNNSFQVVSTSQKPGKPAITTFTKVTWNEGFAP